MMGKEEVTLTQKSISRTEYACGNKKCKESNKKPILWGRKDLLVPQIIFCVPIYNVRYLKFCYSSRINAFMHNKIYVDLRVPSFFFSLCSQYVTKEIFSFLLSFDIDLTRLPCIHAFVNAVTNERKKDIYPL